MSTAAITDRIDTASLAAKMVAAFGASLPSYRRLPTQTLQGEIRDVVDGNIALFLRVLREQREPTDDELGPFRLSAGSRAIEGVPLDDVLHAYRVGGQLCWEAAKAAAREGEEPMLIEVAQPMMRYIDAVSATVAQAYLDEHQHVVSEEDRGLRHLLEALVTDGPLAADALALADRLAVPVQEHYWPLVITIPGESGRRHAELAREFRRRGFLAITEGGRVIALAPQAPTREELSGPGRLVAVGIATPRRDLADAVDELRAATELMTRLRQNGVFALDQIAGELLATRLPRLAEALEQAIIAPLRDQARRRNSGELLVTLETYLNSGLNRAATAGRLHVHPNTLDHRLRRIRELTGLSLADAQDVMRATLALVRWRAGTPLDPMAGHAEASG